MKSARIRNDRQKKKKNPTAAPRGTLFSSKSLGTGYFFRLGPPCIHWALPPPQASAADPRGVPAFGLLQGPPALGGRRAACPKGAAILAAVRPEEEGAAVPAALVLAPRRSV